MMKKTIKSKLVKFTLLLCCCLLTNEMFSQFSLADETITICEGESTTINLNLDNYGFETGCFTCNAIRFENISWAENGINVSSDSSFTISPTQSTTYLLNVTVESGCAGLPSPFPCGVSPYPYRSFTVVYQVEISENCDPTDEPQIIVKYPWINNIVDTSPDGCNGTSIIEYNAGSYNFIHVIDPSGSSLYFENGTFYCSDSPGYSCVDAYNLTNIVDDSFSCIGSSNPGCTDPNASNYDPSATEDDGMCEYDPIESSIFSDYLWLSTLVNPNNCSNESITLYDAGSYYFLEIKSGASTELYYQNGTYYCSDSPGYSCAVAYSLTNVAATWSCGDISNSICDLAPEAGPCDGNERRFYYDNVVGDCLSFQYGGCEGNDNNFATYFACVDNTCVGEVQCPEGEPIEWEWIQNRINNLDDCFPSRIGAFEADGTTYISIAYEDKVCPSHKPIDYYSCNGRYVCLKNVFAPPGSNDTDCEFGDIQNSRVIWTYDNSFILGCIDPAAINYNANANTNDGSCIYETDCNNHQGTFFFEDCGGVNYFFIQLTDGRIFDPYFADGISFSPFEGQQVNFDFVLNSEVSTPCTISEAPITITCIEEVSVGAFEAYPWLSDIFNPNNCNEETIKVYDAGSYNFISIQTSTGIDLYYQNGTYYCSDAPGYSCVQAYNLSNVTETWSCGEIPNDVLGCTDPTANNYNPLANINDGSCTYSPEINFNFATYLWLNPIVNPINCSQQPMVTEYDFGNYAFIYVKTVNGGSLYRNDGVFYCSDEDGQTCLNNYNLTNATTTWACGNGLFQNFDYTYTICAGEEVTLTPEYVLKNISCVCPPCAPVGPPAPPIATWTPPNACPNNNCFATTVSPASTTVYTALAESLTIGSTGCFPPGPDGAPGPITQTTFLVIVEPCNPTKSTSIKNSQKTAQPTFHMYPNPTTDKVFVELPDDGIYQISLMDVSGKVMKQLESSMDASILEINVQDIPKGMYLMALQNEDQQIIQKLIIE